MGEAADWEPGDSVVDVLVEPFVKLLPAESLVAPAPAPSPTPAPTPSPTTGFTDMGAGCCSTRDLARMSFKGMVADLDACQTKCQDMAEKCGAIEYGWKNSMLCIIIPPGVDCSTTLAGPTDCGSGGGDSGVHTYIFDGDR